MNSQKEIEEFLEIDKATIELVEGYASCMFSEGEEIGKIKSEARAWQKVMHEVMPMIENLPKEDKLHPIGIFIIKKWMEAQEKGDKAYKTWKPDKESESLKKAFWKVLNKRIENIR
jgi:hypothetical protein